MKWILSLPPISIRFKLAFTPTLTPIAERSTRTLRRGSSHLPRRCTRNSGRRRLCLGLWLYLCWDLGVFPSRYDPFSRSRERFAQGQYLE